MNRLLKKCFVGSTALHMLLFVVLLVGPAFLSRKNTANDMPVLDVIPSKLVDELMSGGGNPNAKPPPPAPQVVPPPEPVQQPLPPQPEKVVKQEQPQKEAPKPPKPDPIPDDKPKRKPLPEVSTKLVSSSDVDSKAKEKAKAEAQAKARAEAARRAAAVAIQSTARSLKERLSSSTTVEMPGPGGEAYANFAQAVKSVYTQAWIAPEDVTDESASTKVTVTIARDGTVISARIIRNSGNGSVDKSVQETLQRVKTIGQPFPEGAKEEQRSFTINFNLKAKRLLG